MHFTGFLNKLRATIGFSKCARNGPPRTYYPEVSWYAYLHNSTELLTKQDLDKKKNTKIDTLSMVLIKVALSKAKKMQGGSGY